MTTYKQLDPISHILLRPDMYCGSVKFFKSEEFIYLLSKQQIIKKEINKCPAMLRVFIEVLSNSIDNVKRSIKKKIPCSNIKIKFDEETQEISVFNDGDVIPIEKNMEQGCYNHSMIFGRLLTGSNYDDDEDRTVSGRNGIGSKLCNIFSSKFTVESCDPFNKKIFRQTWTRNMRETTGPIINDTKLTKGFTKVSWILDFEKFKVSKYPKDMLKLYLKYILDASVLSGVKVYYNDSLIHVNSLTQYARLYSPDDCSIINIKDHHSDVVVVSSNSFDAVSFVNGVYTKLGGVHVDSWCECVFRPIVDKLNSKHKKQNIKLNISDIKQFFKIFIVSTVVRPEFDGQDKNKLESPDINCVVKPQVIKSILKWPCIQEIEAIYKSKEMLGLKKVEKKSKKTKIDSYDKANKAGSKDSKECTLIICEGLSAKTYAVAGIQQGVYGSKGRDYYGILPLTGKILNVRNSTVSSISANKVIVNLIHAIGLRYNVDYTDEDNFKTLNYGKIMLMTDADCDGIHIEGLLMNFFHSLFPSLLKRHKSFIVSMKTPIARVIRKKPQVDLLFYDEKRFVDWVAKQTTKVNVKYYKGLGTTKTEDVCDTFGIKMVEYTEDDKTTENMNKIFNKDDSNKRKDWLGEYSKNTTAFSLDDQSELTSMSITQFLNSEMIKFSHADCARSIPNIMDGLKQSQRKILYAVMKNKLKYNGKSMKVAQLSGYTAQHSNYHHGEQNLHDTIIGLAHDFTGSNNIPLLYRDGQFGSRLDGGQDAASARYIFTKMDMLTEYIFKEEDSCILNYLNDDGDLVEPEHYLPIIPMILVNGCSGIGTGWSSNIPCFNPTDIINNIKKWMTTEDKSVRYEKNECVYAPFDDMVPWYRNHKGLMLSEDQSRKFCSHGVVEKSNKKNTSIVTELPVGMWTNTFKDACDDMVINKKIKSYKNYSGPNKISFHIIENDTVCTKQNLKLKTTISTSNMVLFNTENNIVKYISIDHILDEFCRERLKWYTKRKNKQSIELKKHISHLKNKVTFVNNIITGNIKILNIEQSSIINQISKLDIPKESGSYDYLLNLPLRSCTSEKVDEYNKQLREHKIQLKKLINTPEQDTWLSELDLLQTKYNQHYV